MNNKKRTIEYFPLKPICQVSKINNTTYVVTGIYAGDISLESKITNILRREMEETDERFYGT